MGPSRADMADNWGAERKFVPSGPGDRGRGGLGGGSFRDGPREGGFRDRSRWAGVGPGCRCSALLCVQQVAAAAARRCRGPGRCCLRLRSSSGLRADPKPAACLPASSRDEFGGPSRADETDDWGKTKQFVPSSRGGFEDRRGGFGGGFRDRDGSRDGGFRDRSPPAFREPSKADTEERWSRCVGSCWRRLLGAGRCQPEEQKKQLHGTGDAVSLTALASLLLLLL